MGADAGFAVPRLYRLCEAEGLGHLIGIWTNAVFKRHTALEIEHLLERFEATGGPCRHFPSRRHRASTRGRTRRVLYKVEVRPEGSNRRFVVTDVKGFSVHLWRLYCDRGTAEGFIGQLKNGLKADRLSCRRFVANAFRLLQCALTRLLKVGARVHQTVRRIWVHIAGGFPHRGVLALVLERIQAMPNAPPARA